MFNRFMMVALVADDPESASEPRPDDAELVARAARGDSAAFALLYEAHRKRMYRLAYGILLDANDAREATQEAFLRLHLAAPSWEPRAAVGTWLYRVVLNHCLNLRKRLQRFLRSRFESAAPGGSPERRAELGEVTAIVSRTLAALPMRQRAVACLFLDGELRPADIAPLVDMTPNATRVALHRALARLRAALNEAGFEAAETTDERLSFEQGDADDDAS